MALCGTSWCSTVLRDCQIWWEYKPTLVDGEYILPNIFRWQVWVLFTMVFCSVGLLCWCVTWWYIVNCGVAWCGREWGLRAGCCLMQTLIHTHAHTHTSQALHECMYPCIFMCLYLYFPSSPECDFCLFGVFESFFIYEWIKIWKHTKLNLQRELFIRSLSLSICPPPKTN